MKTKEQLDVEKPSWIASWLRLRLPAPGTARPAGSRAYPRMADLGPTPDDLDQRTDL
jgi:hypothetical protein